jgi:hypothetical protein
MKSKSSAFLPERKTFFFFPLSDEKEGLFPS